MNNALPISVPKEKIMEFCRTNHIQRMAFFGSVLTDRFRPESDVDVLVEFEKGVPIGFFELSGMEIMLSKLLGRQVDLRTPQELSRHFREKVLASALVQYERN